MGVGVAGRAIAGVQVTGKNLCGVEEKRPIRKPEEGKPFSISCFIKRGRYITGQGFGAPQQRSGGGGESGWAPGQRARLFAASRQKED